MDKQSSSVNQWTKGSNNDSNATQKPDFNSKAASNNNSFEFLDMSSCDETQKLKLKNTLSSPSSFSTQRDRYRSNFATRNSSIKPTPQQYSTIQYHANSNAKNQKSNYQFYPAKHLEPVMRHVSISTRSFSSDANNFSSKNNSNFNNTLSNTTNVSSKRLDDNRHYLNTQDKLNKWHSTNKKPPYVGLKEPTQVNQREAKRPIVGPKEPLHYQSKDLPRDSNKNFSNMSPPMTNTTTTSTTMTMSNQSNVSVPHQTHYNSQQIQYGSTPMHPQMYPSGTVPLISPYPIHSGFMTTAPPGQPMIPYSQHSEENLPPLRDGQFKALYSIPQSQHMMNSTRGSGGRRGRSRGGNNNLSRRDYQMRQSNQNQQSSEVSNDYGQSLMEPPQGTVINPAAYQQIYFHPYPAYYGGPNGAGPHLAALPPSASAANAQNLTGQPLFAIQPQMLYGYSPHHHYPIMYNMMPAPSMTHQQSDMENEHNQSQEGGNGNATAVLQQIPWPHHVAYQEPQQIFQHSPHLSASEVDLDFQVQSPEEYQMQMMPHPNSFHLITTGPHGEILDAESLPQEEEFIDPVSIDSEPSSEQQIYHDDDNSNEDRLLIEKTRDLMIQTTLQGSPHHSQECNELDVKDDFSKTVPNSCDTMLSPKKSAVTEIESDGFGPKLVDNKMSLKNKEKPPSAWGPVPTLPAAVKKQTTSVSVSAIPNKDVLHLQKHSDPSIDQSDINSTESKPHNDKDHQQMQATPTSFSSIIAAKQPMQTVVVDVKKTENKKHEAQQPLQKQQEAATIERVKQQIATTIATGGLVTSQELSKKPESSSTRATQSSNEDISIEKVVQASKPAPQTNTTTTSWANLFSANEGATAPKLSPKAPSYVTPQQQPNAETQTSSTAKNPEPQNVQASSPQVPGGMSYSAVSAQFVPASSVSTTATQLSAASGVSTKLPQKMNLPNNNDNQVKPAPVDQHALRLGDFFSKYKIESNSISLLPRGLLNKSNYCYINAILQALVACPPFYHLMKSIPQLPASYKSHTKTPVTDAMVELVSNYSQLPYRKWVPREKGKKDEAPEISRDTAFEPVVILKMLQALRTEFSPVEGRQEDAEEFLSFILNRMNDEMIELKKLVEKPKIIPVKEENGGEVNGETAPPGDDDDEWQVISGTRNKSTITRNMDFGRSPISDIFRGKSRLRIHREGDHSSDTIEPFFTLKLNIDKAPSVREALENLCARDSLEGVTCSRTNQEVTAWQQVTLEELPVVLILHLKCFDYKKETATKILKTVEFPVELKLDQKIIASKKYQARQKQYKLFAVVYHDGKEASKGHYITDVFHVGYSSWIRYDDSTVKAVPEGNVLHPKSPRVPYLLYYRRYDTIGGNRDHNCNNHQTNQKSTK